MTTARYYLRLGAWRAARTLVWLWESDSGGVPNVIVIPAGLALVAIAYGISFGIGGLIDLLFGEALRIWTPAQSGRWWRYPALGVALVSSVAASYVLWRAAGAGLKCVAESPKPEPLPLSAPFGSAEGALSEPESTAGQVSLVCLPGGKADSR